MTNTSKAPVLVVLQLTGGNDYLNTVIPYTNPLYRDYRPVVGIPEDKVLPLDDKVAFHPAMGPMKPIYERGDMAIIHGVGYPNAPRSHFRSMRLGGTSCATIRQRWRLGRAQAMSNVTRGLERLCSQRLRNRLRLRSRGSSRQKAQGLTQRRARSLMWRPRYGPPLPP